MLSVTLPAGSWVVTSNATVYNFAADDYIRCGVYRGATALNVATTQLGNTGLPVVAGLGPMGAFKSSSGVTVSLRCSHDAVGSYPYIKEAVLWAHHSSSLNAY